MSDYVPAKRFFAEYHGHTVPHLRMVHRGLKARGYESFIFLAGDSSLDNKHWLFPEGRAKINCDFNDDSWTGCALNGYQYVLRPPRMVKDVSYWLNLQIDKNKPQVNNDDGKSGSLVACINASVEESALFDRENDKLLPQDVFIRESITENDILLVSVGGNDIALKPTCCTIFNMAWLIFCSCTCCIRYLSCGCAFPCCGCGFPPGLGHFIHMFKTKVENFVKRITSKKKPKKVVVCMIYFLDERPGGSWADRVLATLGYDTNPEKLQTMIKQVFRLATQRINIPGTEVVAYPLFKVLDGKNTDDYDHRVEPSVSGGQKMGEALYRELFFGMPHQKSHQKEDYGTIENERSSEEDLKKQN